MVKPQDSLSSQGSISFFLLLRFNGSSILTQCAIVMPLPALHYCCMPIRTIAQPLERSNILFPMSHLYLHGLGTQTQRTAKSTKSFQNQSIHRRKPSQSLTFPYPKQAREDTQPPQRSFNRLKTNLPNNHKTPSKRDEAKESPSNADDLLKDTTSQTPNDQDICAENHTTCTLCSDRERERIEQQKDEEEEALEREKKRRKKKEKSSIGSRVRTPREARRVGAANGAPPAEGAGGERERWNGMTGHG